MIIQVLDSRDPLGTRSREAEDAVRSHSDKKLILVLNKCDLVPVENLEKWVNYLQGTQGVVVLPFKANTQKQKDRYGSVGAVNMKSQVSMETRKSIGVSDLLGLLGTWSRGAAGGLTVGGSVWGGGFGGGGGGGGGGASRSGSLGCPTWARAPSSTHSRGQRPVVWGPSPG